MKNKIIQKGKMLKLLAVSSTVLFAPELFAAVSTVGGQLDNVVQDVESTGALFRWIVALVGAFFVFGGINGLKKYADDPRSNPLMKPLIMTLCGGLALGFGAFSDMLAGTTTGSEKENEEIFDTTGGKNN